MGDPRRQKKKYDTPRFPWKTDALQRELQLLGQYGLRNKTELWRHETSLSKFRSMARSLIGKTARERKQMEEELLKRLKKIGVLHVTAVLDDVLDLTIEDILERRLQTIVFRKELASTIYQARQLVTHGHIAVGKQRVTVPSYLVERDEEKQVHYSPSSSLSDKTHHLRNKITAAEAKLRETEKMGD